jgi:microcystin-dependent protein
MTSAATLLELIAHARQHVTALESLIAGMTTGLRAGMIDPDHMHMLMSTQARAINAQLDQVVAVAEKTELRTTADKAPSAKQMAEEQQMANESSGSSLCAAPMGGIVGKR